VAAVETRLEPLVIADHAAEDLFAVLIAGGATVLAALLRQGDDTTVVDFIHGRGCAVLGTELLA
jgi:hypothetical protein